MRKAILFLALVFLSSTVRANVPSTISMQGRLTDTIGSPVTPGLRVFTFRLFDSENGGTELWPGGSGEVQLIYTGTDGLWAAGLGDSIPLSPSVFAGTSAWLAITVNDGVHPPETLSRIRLRSQAYSIRSATSDAALDADSLGGLPYSAYSLATHTHAISSAEIVDGSIGFLDIAQNGADTGQVMKWNGSAWVAAIENVGSSTWTLTDSVVSTDGYWGITRGNAQNELCGDSAFTHVNLGSACTTGVLDQAVSFATVGGGNGNLARGNFATVSGGLSNEARGQFTFVAGGMSNRALSVAGTVGGGENNMVVPDRGTIAGGSSNFLHHDASSGFIGGGSGHNIWDAGGTISGGSSNSVGGFMGTVGGGQGNIACRVMPYNYMCTVGGGYNNVAQGPVSTVAGGEGNVAGDSTSSISTWKGYAAVGGGTLNYSLGIASTIPGGYSNHASGDYSLGAGRRAHADSAGSFTWADSSDFDFHCGAVNEFAARATGGVRFVSGIDGGGVPISGVVLAAGSGSWSSLSDSSAKENVKPIEGTAVLESLDRLPITEWSYKSQAGSVRHLGPMAQDFRTAFGLGESERYISSVDISGVALAAIQELYRQNVALQRRVEQLEARLGE